MKMAEEKERKKKFVDHRYIEESDNTLNEQLIDSWAWFSPAQFFTISGFEDYTEIIHNMKKKNRKRKNEDFLAAQ